MIKFFISLLLSSLLLSTSTLCIAADEEWRLGSDEDGILVELKDLPEKSLTRFKATTTIKANKEQIFDYVKDLPNYCTWFADCGEARFVKKISETESIGYFVNTAPWPVESRDATYHRTLSVTANGGLRLDLVAQSGHLPEQDCCIRIQDAKGYILVEDGSEPGHSIVTYEFYYDPAGDVPLWLVNSMITENPTNTLENLRDLIER